MKSARFRGFWLHYAAPALIALYAIAGITLALIRHASFHTDVLDLGYFTHIVWNTSQGRLFANDIPPNPPISLQDHFALALIFLAPMMWGMPDARALLIATILCLVLAMIPVYLIVRDKHPLLAPFVVLAMVLNPLGHQLATAEFHDIMLALPVLSFALYALYRKKQVWLTVAFGLALLVREDMGVYVACFGLLMLIIRPGFRRLGLAALVIGLGWSLAIVQIVIPMFGAQYRHVNVFINMGDSFGQIAQTMLSRLPTEFVGLFTAQRLGIYLRLFLPLAFLPLFVAGEQLLWLPAS